MGWFRKSSDPIAARERELNQRLAALQAEIRELERGHEESAAAAQELRPGPGSGGVVRPNPSRSGGSQDPIFEPVESPRLSGPAEAKAEHYNELGGRKLDVAGWWRRLQHRFHPPPPMNPKLVNYLAAGSIQGLRPLRYERRVARNQVLLLLVVLAIVALAVFGLFLRSH